jgi:hypothetical protein
LTQKASPCAVFDLAEGELTLIAVATLHSAE